MEMHAGRHWSWADWFVSGVRLTGFILSLLHTYGFTPEDKRGLVIALALLSYAIPQLFYLPGHIRPRRFMAAEVLLSGGFTIYCGTFVSDNAASGFLIPLFVMSFLASGRWLFGLILASALLTAAALDLAAGAHGRILLAQSVNFALFMAFGFTFGIFLRQKTQLAQALKAIEAKNAELERYIHQVGRMTLLEERSRMARELHDTVGHSLTASIVAMEAVRTLMERDPEAARDRLTALITFNRSHLDQFRRTVHDMAMNELKLPLDELLRQAAESFAAQTGTKLQLEAGQDDRPVSDAIKLVLLRCLQEALTNAAKHGHATEIRVRLARGEGGLRLDVADNGAGFDAVPEGFGLQNMRERIESVHGTIHIESSPGAGTSMHVAIPSEG